MLYREPELTSHDREVLGQVHELRQELREQLRTPRRWQGTLRRTSQARAVQGSSSIEGYVVDHQDAAAAIDGEEPMSADARTWAEILGYRRVLTYVIQMAQVPGFRVDEPTIRAMHYMLLEHEMSTAPGRWREKEIYVQREGTGETVYQGPSPTAVPGLVSELVASLDGASADPLISGALAHLNLVMIHPFRDGNGRMARVLQTLVIGRAIGLEPTFASIEEWLGRHTEDYYQVLARTGEGAWTPERDTSLWVRFILRAHHMQAQTVRRRFQESSLILTVIAGLVGAAGLPERVEDTLFDAVLGIRVRRPAYVERTLVDERTATRDLGRLSDAGLLSAYGNTKGRYYLAGPRLTEAVAPVRAGRAQLLDPYPHLLGH